MSEAVLEQHEIDSLVEAIRDGRLQTGKDSLAHLRDVRRIDFSDSGWNQDRIIRRRLPVLDLVFDRLAPGLQITLTKSLRFPVRAEAAPVELKKFRDFREAFQGQSILMQVMRLEPLRGLSLIALEPSILYALVDALMGGLGIAEPPGDREISDIEIGLVYGVCNDVLRDFENAWRPWFPLRVEHVRSDRNTQLMSTLSDEEVCHVGKIYVTADVLPQTPIYFVLPYTNLEPLHDAISAKVGEDLDPNWRAGLEQNLRETDVEVSASLGEARATTSRINSLAEGDVIELPGQVGSDLPLRVEGLDTFSGRLGKSHYKYALRITQTKEIEHQIVDRTMGQILVRKGLISREQLAVAQVDELLNRRGIIDSVVGRGWVERRVLEAAMSG